MRIREVVPAKEQKLELTEADIIVSGGRGVEAWIPLVGRDDCR